MSKHSIRAVVLALLAMSVLGVGCSTVDSKKNDGTDSQEMKPIGYSEEKISFENEETGIELVGILFTPNGIDKSQEQVPGIIVTGPLTTVKEQAQSIYARRLAERGFVTMVFDHTYYGESGGAPRRLENPIMKDSDIKSAVSYLSSVPYVDSSRIGGVGICGGGGQMTFTASSDRRIKAVAGVVPYGIGVDKQLERLSGEEVAALEAQRDAYERGEAEPEYAGSYPAPYYLDPERGGIPEFDNIGTVTWSTLYFGDYDLEAALRQLAPTPLLIISPEQNLSPTAEVMNEIVTGTKEYHFIEGSNHFDHYDLEPYVTDNVQYIVNFFQQYL
ncbi:MAG: alpha/beta hydrolase [Sphaerochaetaceae bacterium]